MKKGFTLIELIVVVVIIAILMALLLPAMSKMRWQTKKVACVNNLRQIGIALLLYADEHDDGLPLLLVSPSPSNAIGRYDAPDIYPRYADDYTIFHCPSWHNENWTLPDTGWPDSNTYSFYWTSGSNVVTDSDGSIIPASIKGGTYVLAFCGSYSGCHGHLESPGIYSTYVPYTGKNILKSDGAIAYVYADNPNTAGKTPRANFIKPGGTGNYPRNWRW